MARTLLTSVVAPGDAITTGLALPFVAADVANMNMVKLTGNQILLAYNSDGSSHNITLTSVNDPYGRKGDIVNDPIAAGTYEMYGPMLTRGWQQADGNLYFQADNALVKFAIISLS